MRKTVVGIFNSRDAAEDAITRLERAGYNPKEDVSVVTQDTNVARDLADSTGANVAEGAVSGAATGGAIGALAGLLIGVGAIAIPGIGGLLIGGPIAAALGLSGAAATTVSGALTGALAGGLVGALVGLGVPEESAKVYEERVKSGGILVAVPARDADTQAADILTACGATDISTFDMK